MAKCDYCGTRLLLGGRQAHRYRFCNQTCQQNGYALIVKEVPQDYLWSQITAIHQVQCSRGKGAPVDVHTSYHVWSILYFTSWHSQPHVCCQKCGRSSQIKDLLFSLCFGWWGFPWGIIFTPIQIARNLKNLLNPPDPTKPSPQLYRLVQIHIGESMFAIAPALN